MRLEYLPTPASATGAVLPLEGPEAAGILIVQARTGFGLPKAKAVTTRGPGQRAASVRDVLVDLPHEMSVTGTFVAADLDDWVQRYEDALAPWTDRMVAAAAGLTPALPVLRASNSTGQWQRRVITREFHKDQDGPAGGGQAFEIVWESNDPVWFAANARTQSLVTGSNTVTVGGSLAVYPTITVTPGGGGVSSVVIASVTAGRQVSVASTVNPGSVLTLNLDPDPTVELAVITTAGVGASAQGGMAATDRRFPLLPGANILTVSYSGPTPQITIAWREARYSIQ